MDAAGIPYRRPNERSGFVGGVIVANVILDAFARQEVCLLPEEIEVLRQDRQATNEAGLQVVRVKFVPKCDRITPVLKMFSRLFGKCFRPDKSSNGWSAFTAAIDIRNQITHPKDATSLAIDNSELNAVERARQWFADSVEALLYECA
jgi:hypothetical protein